LKFSNIIFPILEKTGAHAPMFILAFSIFRCAVWRSTIHSITNRWSSSHIFLGVNL
jgi:hypothetical protein